MPQLLWDDLAFLAYLGVAPVVDEEATSHKYEVKQNDLRLLLTVRQFESVIELSLLRVATDATIFSFTCYVRGEIRYIDDKRGKYLEFIDCVTTPSRFWYQTVGDVFDRDRFPYGLTVQLEVRPEIRVGFVP